MHEVLEIIKEALGQPAYERGNALLFCGDCLELMPRIPSECFSLTVTSPPYNIGKEYEASISLDAYVTWSESWLNEVARLTTIDGAFWHNLGYFAVPEKGKAVPIPYLLWDRVPLFFLQEIVWNYGAGVACRNSFSPRNEKFLWYVKDPGNYIFNLDDVRDPNVKYPNQRKNGKLKCNPNGKNPTDVWQFPKVTSGAQRSSRERTSHPAQFPIAVIERIIKACSNPGDVLFDPFMGSGSVAESAIANNRAVIGIELNSSYVDIASARIDAAFARIDDSRLILFPSD